MNVFGSCTTKRRTLHKMRILKLNDAFIQSELMSDHLMVAYVHVGEMYAVCTYLIRKMWRLNFWARR